MQSQVAIGEDIIKAYKPYRRSPEQPLKMFTVGVNKFEVDPKYELGQILGQGAYGVVVAGKDTKAESEDRQDIAIKKIGNAFEHKIYTKRTLRELKLLRLLTHENIISIVNLVLPKSREDFQHMYQQNQLSYVVSDLMQSDLTNIIKSQQELNDDHYQYFMYQILRGLKYLHSAGVVHRDLKPRNILVNANCDLKICDFGLARVIFPQDTEKTNKLTDYVATRWYRPPELLLEAREYEPNVDIWSVGCIFAEMIKRKPFLPGGDCHSQLELVCENFGTPRPEDFPHISDGGKKVLQKLAKKPGRPLKELLPKASDQALDLISRMLTVNPSKRITVAEALEHPYFSKLHDPTDEPTRQPINSLEFEFQSHNLTMQQYKDLVYEQILLYHFPAFKQSYMDKLEKHQSITSHVLNNSNAKVTDPNTDNDYEDDE